MRILLQNKKTSLFVGEAGAWTIHPGEAYSFINSDKAIEFALEQQLADVQMVLWFEELKYSLTVPFQREQQPPVNGAVQNLPAEEREQV